MRKYVVCLIVSAMILVNENVVLAQTTENVNPANLEKENDETFTTMSSCESEENYESIFYSEPEETFTSLDSYMNDSCNSEFQDNKETNSYANENNATAIVQEENVNIEETTVDNLVIRNDVIKITEQPSDVTVKAGETFNVQVKAEGTGLKYQWQYCETEGGAWKDFSYANEATLTKKMFASWDGWQVRCVVKDKSGNSAETTAVHLMIRNDVIKITEQPSDVTVKAGETFNVQVKAEGTGLKYQWQYCEAEGGAWKDFSYANGATLTKKMLVSWDGLKIRCYVRNEYGNIEKSNVVTLHLASDNPAWVLNNGILTFLGKIDTKVIQDKDLVESVVIEGATQIPDRAFYNWPNLKSVTIGKSVKKIGNSAFFGCKKLEMLTLSQGLEIIGANAFRENYKISTLVIPTGVTTIGNGAFWDCYNLKKVKLSSTITEMPSAFGGQTKIETIGPAGGNYDLEYSWIDNSEYSQIPDNAFKSMSYLTSAVIEGVKGLGAYTFENCTRLKKVSVGNKVKYIFSGAFHGDISLECVIMSDEIITIGPYEVFDGCNPKMIIYCPINSYAMKWAKQNGIGYVCQ